jgi:hypothetical protein
MALANVPKPEVKEGKRGFTTLPYLQFAGIPYQLYQWTDQAVWRNIVEAQPVSILCRETIIERVSSIDWRIEPVDPTKRQELRSEIRYYTRKFEQNNGMDVVSFNEWVLGDGLDLPFGSGVELIWRDDNPSNRLVDYVPLDGATLFPTNRNDWPVVQKPPGSEISDWVPFPDYAINRLYYAPRRDIKWRGWGMPPPEKIYLAIQMLVQGDQYYWKLLIDTPEAGILDLLDMEKTSAEEWLASMQALLVGQDPLKVPVLYEHTMPARFIPFGRPPADILYDKTTLKYAAITCAGYGISLSDIGIGISSSGGETLAGTIRQERNTNRKGIGFAKEKMRLFRNRMLPSTLQWVWIDPDEEQQVARGRALLSSSAAFSSMIDKRIISPKEARQAVIAAGLLNVALPEDIPLEDFDNLPEIVSGEQTRENMLTATQPPSSGGQGEVRQSMAVDKIIENGLTNFVDNILTIETVDLEDDEFLELMPLLETYINEKDILNALMEFYEVQYNSMKTQKSFFSRDRWKSFDENAFKNEIENGLKSFPNKIAETMILAKSYALDNLEEVSDNFRDYQTKVVYDLIKLLATSIGERVKSII